ncbi:ABC transporter substrate-binding protein [Acidovorax sp.]|uniref:ABC transporter substrate-binding protein n=1 Tax=Acidovorax sp. TaxID=1872122 RepID=UPI002ACEB551|nr:ABC transporter substrate-binding protein [Acidovorax sp.]MDZ7866402.1 ABC transporter substrate-binding protein [Acidovorax sp.]
MHSTPRPSRYGLQRRHWLQGVAAMGLAGQTWAQGSEPSAKKADAERSHVVAQVADLSPDQQDVSRDFLVGSRTAWQEINAKGGVQGRPVQHQTLETDGSPASLQSAWESAQRQTRCIALSGCVGNTAASGLIALQAKAATESPLAFVAPWLHDTAGAATATGAGDTVFDVFAGHEAQITHAIRNLASMGVQTVGVAYANAAVRRQSEAMVAHAAQSMALKVQAISPPGAAAKAGAGARVEQTIILFIGGTPELFSFLDQLALPQGRQCYVVALADVNLQVLAQMGPTAAKASVIVTQAVPLVNASLPVVRSYRDALARFYDEPPSPLGLAGYIAARYTAEVMGGITGPVTRASMLAALQKRASVNIGGYAIGYQGRQRTNAYVTQSMLTNAGRIIG